MHERRAGKSHAAHLIKETALNAGKKVLVINKSGATLQRRKKHLTIIEFLPKKEPKPIIIYDDPYNIKPNPTTE